MTNEEVAERLRQILNDMDLPQQHNKWQNQVREVLGLALAYRPKEPKTIKLPRK